jgi:hypothetical protein
MPLTDEQIDSRAETYDDRQSQISIPMVYTDLDDGLYDLTFTRGVIASDFSYNSHDVGLVLQITPDAVGKIISVTEYDHNNTVVRVQVVNGIVPVLTVALWAIAALIIIAVGWSLTKVDKVITTASGQEEVITDTIDSDGHHTVTTTIKKPSIFDKLGGSVEKIGIVVVVVLAAYYFFIKRGAKVEL